MLNCGPLQNSVLSLRLKMLQLSTEGLVVCTEVPLGTLRPEELASAGKRLMAGEKFIQTGFKLSLKGFMYLDIPYRGFARLRVPW